jgi:hypothetical protein
MATGDQPGHGWTAVLRGQPPRIVEGRPAGGYTDVFEIICRECGRQRVRGPYPIADGVAAYEKHLGLHQQPGAAYRAETMTDAG